MQFRATDVCSAVDMDSTRVAENDGNAAVPDAYGHVDLPGLRTILGYSTAYRAAINIVRIAAKSNVAGNTLSNNARFGVFLLDADSFSTWVFHSLPSQASPKTCIQSDAKQHHPFHHNTRGLEPMSCSWCDVK
jgi:hypothetical protein